MNRASNNLIRDLKKQKKENADLLFLDNKKIILDAIKAGHNIKIALTDDENFEFKGLDSEKIYLTDRKTIESLSDVKTPQGVCVILEYIQHTASKPKGNFLVMDGLQDPGNVGSLIRSAYACGFDEIFLVDSVKETNPKMIRACAGTNFGCKLCSLSRNEFCEVFKTWNLNLLCADMAGEDIFKANIHGQLGVVVGNEGNGVSQEVKDLCSRTVSIPMKKGIESLNAAVSGSIIMYQINHNKI